MWIQFTLKCLYTETRWRIWALSLFWQKSHVKKAERRRSCMWYWPFVLLAGSAHTLQLKATSRKHNPPELDMIPVCKKLPMRTTTTVRNCWWASSTLTDWLTDSLSLQTASLVGGASLYFHRKRQAPGKEKETPPIATPTCPPWYQRICVTILAIGQ